MRDHSVTIAKGIAIMLMVLGHAGCPSYLNTCLGMIHMPLFFFMSGYCFKENYLSDTTLYIKRRVTGIYWPSMNSPSNDSLNSLSLKNMLIKDGGFYISVLA